MYILKDYRVSDMKESTQKPSYLDFDNKKYYWKKYIDYKKHPELYRVGKGEQGVLICEPYKGEIGKYWKFKTPEIATKSSNEIFELFTNGLYQIQTLCQLQGRY